MHYSSLVQVYQLGSPNGDSVEGVTESGGHCIVRHRYLYNYSIRGKYPHVLVDVNVAL